MVGVPLVSEPSDPFEPLELVLSAGTPLYRVFSNAVPTPLTFNDRHGYGGRFHFFGDPTVPVLYAAESQVAAVCESILHEVAKKDGVVFPKDYLDKVLAGIVPSRDLRLASFLGPGLRRLGIEARNLTATTSRHYDRTVRWAEAAHATGFEGVAYMSHRENSSRAYVFFGDKVSEDDLEIQPGVSRIFASGADFDWLVDQCAVMNIDIEPPV